MHDVIQKHARTLAIEGTVAIEEKDTIKIIICGQKEAIDKFVDALHKELAKISPKNLEIEPFIKEKDYRGVFRVIE